jgi:starvation-inducible DNA-binding protein
MEELLKQLLSDTVALKFKAQGYHWNIEGKDFDAAHSFFSDIYEDYEENIDPLAEWLRKLGYIAPSDLLFFYNTTTVSESISSFDSVEMARDLLESNDQVLNKFQQGVDSATAAGQHALANYFAERMDAHQKWHWQLKAMVS